MRDYYTLLKPGIVRGNLIVAVAGYFLAQEGFGSIVTFAALIIGVVGVIGSACVINNIYDRDIDALMERTRRRPLITGSILVIHAWYFAILLGLVGFSALLFFTTMLATFVALGGFFSYTVLYTVFSKRHTIYATLIGAISGATPPVIGYTAVTNQLDLGALLLFVVLFVWQMPHFFAISAFRRNEFVAAGINVVSDAYSALSVRLVSAVYVLLFWFSIVALSLHYEAAAWYVWVNFFVTAVWLFFTLEKGESPEKQARKAFALSLAALLCFSVTTGLQ